MILLSFFLRNHEHSGSNPRINPKTKSKRLETSFLSYWRKNLRKFTWPECQNYKCHVPGFSQQFRMFSCAEKQNVVLGLSYRQAVKPGDALF